MITPHKHAAVIKAWADGAIIQFRIPNHDCEWFDVVRNQPSWASTQEYRVKPVAVTYWFNVYKRKRDGKVSTGHLSTDRSVVLKWATATCLDTLVYIQTESFTVME